MVYQDTKNASGRGSPSERRRTPRFPYITKLQFLSGQGAVDGVVRNLSTDGLFVETADPFALGGTLDLNFTFRSKHLAMNLTGRVVRQTPQGVALKLF